MVENEENTDMFSWFLRKVQHQDEKSSVDFCDNNEPVFAPQVEHGAVGLCTQTLVETEALVYVGGIEDVYLTNQVGLGSDWIQHGADYSVGNQYKKLRISSMAFPWSWRKYRWVSARKT